MTYSVTLLPGDGIGPEVLAATKRVLEELAHKFGLSFSFKEGLIGGIAIDQTGNPLPDETIKMAEESDAVLLAAVGGPKWDDPTATVRPEQGLLKLRKHFDLFANLRPVKIYPSLAQYAPLRPELLAGVDILFVRELTSGIYFGEREEQKEGQRAFDTMSYEVSEVERVAHVAYRAAQRRRRKVTSVDKANVLASMRLWRGTVTKLHEDYQEVALEHLLVDACTMHLVTRPRDFDVILAGNMFGDILSDEASVLAGSLGMLPSASLGSGTFGVYEPVHGSAPDIAGQGKANPIGMILSAAMMLRYSLDREDLATALETSVDACLERGLRTSDIATEKTAAISTEDFASSVIDKL